MFQVFRLAVMLVCVMAGAALAGPISFMRDEVVLMPKEVAPDAATKGVKIGVDIRDSGSVFEAGWLEFAGLAEGRGLLLTNEEPVPTRLAAVPFYAAVDVLFLDIYGSIIGILPNQKLAELSEPVTMDADVLAMLYLRGGTADALGLLPGDRVVHSRFKTRPVIRTKDNTPRPKVLSPEEEKARREALEKKILKRHHEQ